MLDGKGGKQRVVPASTRVLFELRAYGLPTRGPVCRGRDGVPGAPSAERGSQLVNEHLRDLGLADTGHAARHRFATRALHLSHDLRMVQLVAHRVLVMYLGQVVEMAPARTLATGAAHPYSRHLSASVDPFTGLR